MIKQLKELKKEFTKSFNRNCNEPALDLEVAYWWNDNNDHLMLRYSIESDLGFILESITYNNRDLGIEDLDVMTSIVFEWFSPYENTPTWLKD